MYTFYIYILLYYRLKSLKITLIRFKPCSTSASSFNRLLLWLVSLYFCWSLLLLLWLLFFYVHFAAVFVFCCVILLHFLYPLIPLTCQFITFECFCSVSSEQCRVTLFIVLQNEPYTYSWDNRVIFNPSYIFDVLLCVIFVWCI